MAMHLATIETCEVMYLNWSVHTDIALSSSQQHSCRVITSLLKCHVLQDMQIVSGYAYVKSSHKLERQQSKPCGSGTAAG